jgi:putative two-component system response regulator
VNATRGSIVRHRILIVDDAQDNVDMIEAFLADEASAIKGVTQSNQVERVFNEFEPDIMLLDLHMPAPDGLEILRNLRGVRESLGFLPVIVLTGDTGRTARNSALLLGADDFLIKPLDRQEVVLRVRNLLRTRRLYVELAEANRALEKKLH